jgi:hypothetical protein
VLFEMATDPPSGPNTTWPVCLNISSQERTPYR